VPYALFAKTAGNVDFSANSVINANNNRITNVAAPIEENDAVTKATVVALLLDAKATVVRFQ
jgi:hypothetical protein